MNLKRKIALAAVLCLALTMTGCSSDTAVYVQSVKSLASLGGIAPETGLPVWWYRRT